VQKDSLEWLRHRTEAFVWLRVGGGKTAVALMLALDWWKRYGLRDMLVVGPTKVIRDTWKAEILSWEETRKISYQAAIGPLGNRVRAVANKPRILGVNYENLVWLYQTGYVLPEIICFDEGHKMSSHSSKRFKEHEKNLSRFKRRIMLTATPAREGEHKLWGEEASISNIRRLGRNITAFRGRFCDTIDRDQGRYKVSSHASSEIRRLISPITWNPDPATYAKLDKPVVNDVMIGMSPKLRKEYTKLEAEFVLEVETAVASGKTVVEAVNMAVLKNKLRQLCGGFIYDEQRQAIPLDTEKLEALDELLENLHGEQAVIWYEYRWEREQILARVKGAETLDDPGALARWNAGEIPYLVLHPDSGGEGLNLHEPCRMLVWYTMPWSGLKYEQANGRVDRGWAQKREVVIHRLMRRNSVDQDVAKLLAGKERLEVELMREVGQRHA
jgi:SNF2 family DNA or RNA helicase